MSIEELQPKGEPVIRMKPFWSYFGSKYRSAPRYPVPRYNTIVEPFAGSAGYSLRYVDHKVILIEKYPIVAGIWKYLINVSASEIRSIPDVSNVNDLPSWVPQEARWLVGFYMNSGTTSPRIRLAIDQVRLRDRQDNKASKFIGWSIHTRERVASQVDRIKHWTIIEGDYTAAPNVEATWFIDPTYQKQGKEYKYSLRPEDFSVLGAWCHDRSGQLIVCEADGADWLPFKAFGMIKSGRKKFAQEMIWTQDTVEMASTPLRHR